MRGTAFTRSVLSVGLVAFVGSGCEQLNELAKEVQDQHGASNGSGAGGSSAPSTGTAGASGGPTMPPPVPMCVEITEGGPGTCTDYATYKIQSTDVCAQKNLVLSSLKPGPACGDAGGVESMTFVCCAPAPSTVVTCKESTDATGRACKTCVDASGALVSTDCNTSVPGMMCVNIPDGGPTSCKDPGTWKMYGVAACEQQKMQLTNVIGGTTCSAGYQDVTYVCCATTPSGSSGGGGTGGSSGTMPPPPNKCGETTDDSGQVCKTCWDPTGMVISQDCAGGGGGLTGAGGTSGGGSVTCDSTVNADGSVCKQCRDANGNVVSGGCSGSGGTTPPDAMCEPPQMGSDGSQCTTCHYADGSTVTSCSGSAPVGK